MKLKIHHYETLESTMDEARVLLNSNLQKYINHAVLSDVQTKGRGRQARVWESSKGNLFVTYMLDSIDPSLLTQFAMLWGVVLKQTLQKVLLSSDVLQCKWPNDILLNEEKVGGILIERYSADEGEAMLVGVGMNLTNSPTDTIFPATNLKGKIDTKITPSLLTELIYDQFRQLKFEWHVKGFEFIRHQWEKSAWRLGEVINIRQSGHSVVGVFEKIDAVGAIFIKEKNGQQHRLFAGDVFKET